MTPHCASADPLRRPLPARRPGPEVDGPDYVPLEIELTVCVDPDYFQQRRQRSLQVALGSGELPDGRPAFFTPGNFTLGQTVYLSPIYRGGPLGGRRADGHRRRSSSRRDRRTTVYLDQGEIPLGPTQVARMDNDPSYPGHGRLTLVMEGGK